MPNLDPEVTTSLTPGAQGAAASESAAKSTGATPTVPGYELLGVLGRGGMGIVYRARQRALGRPVALKMMRGGAFADADELARFQIEAAAIARLQHPHIVQIFEVGEVDGQPFFSLELVEGGSLAKQLNGTPCPARPAASLMEKLARAVGYAHQRGIIHRDLKPANILLGRSAADTTAGGQSTIVQPDTKDAAPSGTAPTHFLTDDVVPKLTDFGLARVMDDPDGQTQTGAFLGTPSYAAPEQAAGHSRHVGPQTDVYALGAILYELLTGRPPFRGTSAIETLDLVRHQEPVAPRLLNPAIDVDLETICLKCLRKNATERYLSAQDLADDLQRQQQGEPIRARPLGTMQRAVKWAKRRPAVAALLGLGSIAVPIVIAALVSLGYQARLAFANSQLTSLNSDLKEETKKKEQLNTELTQANVSLERRTKEAEEAKSKEEQARTRAESAETKLQRLLYSQDMSEGSRIWSESRPARLGMLLARTRPEKTGGVDLRGFEWHYLNRLHNAALRTIRLQHPIRCSSFGSEGTIVNVAGDDGLVTCWDISKPSDRQFLKFPGHKASVRSFAFTSFYDRCVSGGHDGKVIMWEVGIPVQSHTFEAEGDFVEAVAFSPDGNYVIAASWANTDAKGKTLKAPTSWLQIWHTGTLKEACFIEMPKGGIVQTIACRPDGNLVALGDYTGRITFADVPGGKIRGEFQAHEMPANSNVRGIAFSSDGKRLASAGSDRIAKIWDVSSVPVQAAKLLHTLTGHTSSVTSVAFASDGQRIATGSDDSTVRVWDVNKGNLLRLFKGHTAEVYAVSFAKNGNLLLSAGQDATVKIWDSTAYQEGVVVKQHTHHLRSVVFSADSKQFVAVGLDGQLWIRDATTGAISRGFGEVKLGYASVAASPDGKRLLTGGRDGVLRIWDIAAAKEAFALTGSSEIAGAAFLDDGRAVSGDKEGKLTIWDLTTRKMLRTLPTSGAPILSLACSRDGKHIAAGSADRVARIWDASTGKLVHTLSKHVDWVSAVAFSPDGGRLATASFDGTAFLWDVATGQTVLAFDGHERPIHSIAYSPDGKRIATGGFETIRLWDTTTAQETLIIRAHEEWIDGLAFSPDNRRLASAGWDQTVRVWDGTDRIPGGQ